jgi:hypothetical protein
VRNFVKEDCKEIEPTEKAYHSHPKDKEKTNKESNCSKTQVLVNCSEKSRVCATYIRLIEKSEIRLNILAYASADTLGSGH